MVLMAKSSSAARDLAGGVWGEREGQILGGDAAAVIDNANEVGATGIQVYVDASAAGIDGVFE